MKCSRCDGAGWVCEVHIMRPWEGANACGCGAPRAPCGRCNAPEDGETPNLPEGFKIDFDKDG